MKRAGMVCVLIMALISLAVSACASSTASRPSAPAPAATHAPTATPTPPPPPPVNAYLGVGGTVYALDGRTGARLWTYDAHNNAGNLELSGTTVIFTASTTNNSRDTALYALDATTGALRWQGPKVGLLGPPLIVSGVAYATSLTLVNGAPDTLFAVDVSTGKVLWQRTGVAGVRSEIAVGDTAVYITQQQGGSDVLPPSDGSITALSRADGTQMWQATGHPYRTPLFLNGAVYALTDWVQTDERFYAFDAHSGSPLWNTPLDTTHQFTTLHYAFLTGHTLYLAGDAQISALDLTTHAVAWHLAVPCGEENPSACIAYESGSICFFNFDGMHGVNASTGMQEWSQAHTTNISALIHDAGVCYAYGQSPNDSQFFALDARTGIQHWTATVPGEGRVFKATGSALYALTVRSSPCCGVSVTALSASDGTQLWQFAPSIAVNSGSLAVG